MADGGEVSGRSDNCQPCLRNGNKNAVVKFCGTCQVSFCSTCLGHHDKIFDHNLTQGAEGGVTHEATVESPELCVEHKIPITLYCNEEDKFGCATCMEADHKSCKQLIYLPLAAKALLSDTNMEQLNERLKQTTQELESIKRKLQSSVSNLIDDNEQCVRKVNDHYTRVLNTLKSIFERTTEMIKQTFESIHAELKKGIQNVDDCLTDLEASRSKLEQIQENNTQLFIEVKKCQNRLKTAEEVSENAPDKLKIEGMGVIIDGRLENLLAELQTLANVVRRKGVEVKKKYTLSLSVDGDSSLCHISSSCIVKTGSILAADHTNKRVKHLDGQSLKVLDSCPMQYKPIGVCCIDDNEAVVTCFNNQLVLISIHPKLSIIRTMNLYHTCGYVAYYDGELFITDIEKTVYVHALDGSLRRNIAFQSGVNLFSKALHVHVNDTGDKVFVADLINGLVVINRNGEVVDRLDNQKLTCSRTRGACLDDVGGVFVCDYNGSKVVYVDHKGHVVDILTSADGLNKPLSVCYDRNHRRLIVFQNENNYIIVCEML